ncbi:TPA: hypothetical protein QDC51_001438 [Burkholderia multivorans]|nr:hypothetical protein [Burkholderia multivorans]HDR9840796.1 hypothetical protein [Burkholderia multivorans]HDR9847318.1 hypothetical protein [Burkholderia multivorans]HDR9853732.1 hypothetical protein [Burkholderia multivorans]
MSKVSEAKAAQGWRKKPNTCEGCAHFTMDRVEEQYKAWDGVKTWIREKNLRCSLGGFKTSKTNICDQFEKAKLKQ